MMMRSPDIMSLVILSTPLLSPDQQTSEPISTAIAIQSTICVGEARNDPKNPPTASASKPVNVPSAEWYV